MIREGAAATGRWGAAPGESTAAGCGVGTHDDGFPGALARDLAVRCGRPVTWEVNRGHGATARRTRHRLLPAIGTGLGAASLLAGVNALIDVGGSSSFRWHAVRSRAPKSYGAFTAAGRSGRRSSLGREVRVAVASDDAAGAGRVTRGLRKIPLSDPGRRREVLDVVLTLLADVGYERLTMDLVAQRARASKATLYQRWPTKARLAVAALEQHRPQIADHDAGSLTEDLRHLLTSWLAGWTELDRGLVIALLEGSRTDVELARLRRERLRRPLQQAAESALARAHQRGEIPAGVDPDLLLEMPWALMLMHVLIEGEEPDRALVDRIVDRALAPLLGTTASEHVEP
ncbi:hypothetical protein GCM10020367_61620 [Streptomyces sannanensis]|uniref:HTH tetR-type domain-containing protein n=1 Tax=Streptomyces sannanensis TaxID=285536 RepID=A0ABP6SKG2_9ACTN